MSERITLSIPEAAKRIGCSDTHLYNLAQRGELSTVRFGKRIFVPIKALEEMINGKPSGEQPENKRAGHLVT